VVRNTQQERTISWQTAYVKALRLGPALTDGAILDLSNGSAGAPLAVILSSGLAEVSGKVNGDAALLAGKMAALFSQQADGSRPLLNGAGSGTYFFRAAPGKYYLIVVDTFDLTSIMSRDGLENYLERAEKLELRPRDKVVKDLQ